MLKPMRLWSVSMLDDFHFHILPHLQDFARVRHMLPREFGQVHETFSAADVDERAEIYEG